MKTIALCALLGLIGLAGTVAAEPLDDARALFDRYVELEHAFNPAVANLYTDDALIKNKRIYPNGESVELSVPAPEYKMLIVQAMPVAKATNDVSEYSDVTYIQDGDGFRIQARRFSNLEQHTSPLELKVAPDANGEWRILEEWSESLMPSAPPNASGAPQPQ